MAEAMIANRLRTFSEALVLLTLVGLVPILTLADDGASTASKRSVQRTDFLAAAYLPGLERIVVTGHHGLVGMLEVGESSAQLHLIADVPNEDFTALGKMSDSDVLIGSSTGRVYWFDGKTIEFIAALSEYDEPVLDISAEGGNVWAVGGRGLLARSADGREFEIIDLTEREVKQPQVRFVGDHEADWYLGISNLRPDSIKFSATVGGKPAETPAHYEILADEGFVQVVTPLDQDPPAAIELDFDPGPPFRPGDVSWNAVLVESGKVTIAGEFGMILQSEDNGATWVRRDTEIVPHEPEPPYWLAGVQKGDEMWLTGAGGVSQVSHDGGETWSDNPSSGNEGIFGVTIGDDGKAFIAGAVGLIGRLDGGKWQLADRTTLKLLSWLKTPVAMPDGSLVVTGGRATAIRYSDGEWARIPVKF
ncbi:MAG: hypothetical protein VX929_00765 [Pseudomonadota bacterium]|nr:hypothetical protein [Pseudomonadota bacterium]